jgi:hypothetical protein
MPQEGFLRRWSRLKTRGESALAPPPVPHPDAMPELPALAQTAPHPPVAPGPAAEQPPLPTLEDVARLDANSDFSAFVSQGVDKAVQRLAMKKLFSDPHFNAMDGLDIYIDDYTKSDPVSAAMLASLQHTKNIFAPPDKQERDSDAAPTQQVAGDPAADAPPDSAGPHDGAAAPGDGPAGDLPGAAPAPPDDSAPDRRAGDPGSFTPPFKALPGDLSPPPPPGKA